MKLVLIDDEPFHLIGMQTVIPWEQSQFIIAGEARSGEEGIELILREQPDIAIEMCIRDRHWNSQSRQAASSTALSAILTVWASPT